MQAPAAKRSLTEELVINPDPVSHKLDAIGDNAVGTDEESRGY